MAHLASRSSNLTALFDMVKAVWPDGINYYNEEWTPLNDPTWRDPCVSTHGHFTLFSRLTTQLGLKVFQWSFMPQTRICYVNLNGPALAQDQRELRCGASQPGLDQLRLLPAE